MPSSLSLTLTHSLYCPPPSHSLSLLPSSLSLTQSTALLPLTHSLYCPPPSHSLSLLPSSLSLTQSTALLPLTHSLYCPPPSHSLNVLPSSLSLTQCTRFCIITSEMLCCVALLCCLFDLASFFLHSSSLTNMYNYMCACMHVQEAWFATKTSVTIWNWSACSRWRGGTRPSSC